MRGKGKRKSRKQPPLPAKADHGRRLTLIALLVASSGVGLDVVRFILDESRRPATPPRNITLQPATGSLHVTGHAAGLHRGEALHLGEGLTAQVIRADGSRSALIVLQ